MIKLKSITIALALSMGFIAPSIANADTYSEENYGPPPLPPPPQDTTEKNHGFYLGLGTGFYTLDDSMTHSTGLTIDGSAVKTGSVNAHSGETGINGYVTGGYAWKFTSANLFFATEIFGNMTNAEPYVSVDSTDELGSSSSNVNLEIKYAYGIRALPGVMVTKDAVVYFIGGYARAHADSSSSVTSINNVDSSEDSAFSSSSSSNFNGYQLGLGSMINVSKYVALRGDLIYSAYGDQTLAGGTRTVDNVAVQDTFTANPTSWEGNIGIVAMFD